MRGFSVSDIPECCGAVPEVFRTDCLFHLVCICGRYLTTLLDTEWAAPGAGRNDARARARAKTKRERIRAGKA